MVPQVGAAEERLGGVAALTGRVDAAMVPQVGAAEERCLNWRYDRGYRLASSHAAGITG